MNGYCARLAVIGTELAVSEEGGGNYHCYYGDIYSNEKKGGTGFRGLANFNGVPAVSRL